MGTPSFGWGAPGESGGAGLGSDGGVGRGGGGPGGGEGILNISLFGGIEPAMRPNGVFFGHFWPFFGVFWQTRVFGILPIFRIGDSTKSNFRFRILICQIKIIKL